MFFQNRVWKNRPKLSLLSWALEEKGLKITRWLLGNSYNVKQEPEAELQMANLSAEVFNISRDSGVKDSSRVCWSSKSLKLLHLSAETRTYLQGHKRQREKLYTNPFPILYYIVMELDLHKTQAFYF